MRKGLHLDGVGRRLEAGEDPVARLSVSLRVGNSGTEGQLGFDVAQRGGAIELGSVERGAAARGRRRQGHAHHAPHRICPACRVNSPNTVNTI